MGVWDVVLLRCLDNEAKFSARYLAYFCGFIAKRNQSNGDLQAGKRERSTLDFAYDGVFFV